MDWPTFRAAFPVTRRWAFLDHAAVAPLPAASAAILAEWAHSLADGGVVREGEWVSRAEDARRAAGRLLNADPLDVAFVKNTSEGIGLVAEGLDWRPGDNVVSAEGEYPANVYPWLNLASRGVQLRAVPTRPQGRIAVDDVRAAIDARTRVVALSFVEYATGFRNDLDALGNLCRERGVLFFVDAIQGLGVFPVDVGRTPIDFLAADGHKWLLGPGGAGLLYVRREALDQLRPVGVGWNSVVGAYDFSALDFTLKPHAGRYESGTLPLGVIAALGQSLELLLAAGIERVAARVLALTDHLVQRAARAGVTVFSPRGAGEGSGIVSLECAEPGAAVRRALAAGVVVRERAGRVRVSPHAYNTEDELDALVNLLGGPA